MLSQQFRPSALYQLCIIEKLAVKSENEFSDISENRQ